VGVSGCCQVAVSRITFAFIHWFLTKRVVRLNFFGVAVQLVVMGRKDVHMADKAYIACGNEKNQDLGSILIVD
jgi:hypothetical protein